MDKFSLDNFIKKKEKSSLHPLPEGVKPGSVYNEIFDIAVNKIEEIEKRLNDTEPHAISELTKKSIKIVVDNLVEQLGKRRGSVRMDRAGDLPAFIKNQNDRLERLWKSKLPTGEGKRETKDELLLKIERLEAELEQEKQKKLHEFFDKVVQSQILKSQQTLAKKYNALLLEYQQEQEKNANLSTKLSGLIRELNSKQCIEILGIHK